MKEVSSFPWFTSKSFLRVMLRRARQRLLFFIVSCAGEHECIIALELENEVKLHARIVRANGLNENLAVAVLVKLNGGYLGGDHNGRIGFNKIGSVRIIEILIPGILLRVEQVCDSEIHFKALGGIRAGNLCVAVRFGLELVIVKVIDELLYLPDGERVFAVVDLAAFDEGLAYRKYIRPLRFTQLGAAVGLGSVAAAVLIACGENSEGKQRGCANKKGGYAPKVRFHGRNSLS